jgi:hypothetical protein
MNFYKDASQRAAEEVRRSESGVQRFMDWGRENRYTIVLTSWVAAMALALAMVGRNKYLTTSQKVVQSRMYAQGLTLAVLIASAVFETADAKTGKGRWETVLVVDPNDPKHEHLIEKRVHKEEYEGQDLWKGRWMSRDKTSPYAVALTTLFRHGGCRGTPPRGTEACAGRACRASARFKRKLARLSYCTCTIHQRDLMMP